LSYCKWGHTSELNQKYHDEQWGVPVYDDVRQFEFLMMEVMQCGLNWNMIINKRDIFRSCFDDFDYDKIADYTETDVERIIATPGMIRSVRKIKAVICNARSFQKIRQEFGSFCNYLWKYSNGKTIIYEHHDEGYIPACNGLSDVISKDLKKRGFKFLGSVTVYSHLQACGIINDHGCDCPRYKYLTEKYPFVLRRRYKEKNVQYFG